MKARRARKAHVCDECWAEICVGETYEYTSGIWDGVPQSFHIHTECERWREGLSDAIKARPASGLCECFGFGKLRESLEEYCEEVLGYLADGRPSRLPPR